MVKTVVANKQFRESLMAGGCCYLWWFAPGCVIPEAGDVLDCGDVRAVVEDIQGGYRLPGPGYRMVREYPVTTGADGICNLGVASYDVHQGEEAYVLWLRKEESDGTRGA